MVISQVFVIFVEFFIVNSLFNKFNLLEEYDFNQIMLCFSLVWFGYSFSEMAFRGFDQFSYLIVRGKFDLDGKKQQAKDYIKQLMNPTESEMDYINSFIAKEYKPELLFDDAEIVERIRKHPMALWKCK